MAYSLTTAANPKALLAAIVTFATAQGWTIEYDDSAGAGGNGGQIALSSGNCHVAIGEQSSSANPVAVSGAGGSFSDARLFMAMASAIVTSNKKYWGHTDSLVTTATDSDRIGINDVAGPMDEVHFLGDEDYIFCIVKCAAERWATFGFGNLDTMGMTIPACGFALGSNFPWWATGDKGNGYHSNNEASQYGSLFHGDQTQWDTCHFYIPASVLDAALGFTATQQIVKLTGTRHILEPVRMSQSAGDYTETNGTNGGEYLLSLVLQVHNQSTTGGIALFSVPVIYEDQGIDLNCYLGELPAIRMCRMSNAAPGDEIKYGTDTYKVVPIKRKGTKFDMGFDGGTYDNKPNTFDLAYAVKKVV